MEPNEWLVPYEAGKIEALAYNNYELVADYKLQTSGKPAKIELSADRTQINADCQDLSHITIQLFDEQGVVVQDEDREITVEVVGNGKFIGLDSGDIRKEALRKGDTIDTYFGNALATIQSTGEKGKIRIIVKSKDLPDFKM